MLHEPEYEGSSPAALGQHDDGVVSLEPLVDGGEGAVAALDHHTHYRHTRRLPHVVLRRSILEE